LSGDDWTGASLIDVEGVRVGDTIFAFVYARFGDDDLRGRLVRFNTDGSGFRQADEFEPCAGGNPQIAASNHVLAVACDSTNRFWSVSLYYWVDLTRIEVYGFQEEPPEDDEAEANFRSVDLELFVGPISGAGGGFDRFRQAAVIYFTFQHGLILDDTVVVVRYDPSPFGPDDLDFYEVNGAAAPSLALRQSRLADSAVLLSTYYSNAEDMITFDLIDAGTLERESGMEAEVPGDSCAGIYRSESEWMADGDSFRAVLVSTHTSGGGCPASRNQAILYGSNGAEVAALATGEAFRAEIAFDNDRGDGAWLSYPSSGGWDFSYFDEGTTEMRVTNDIPRTGFHDLLSTDEYFGSITVNGRTLRWDNLGCN
jgi:hypothetical protein